MAKLEDRAVDSGIALVLSKDDPAALEWWKQRFALIAGVPTDVARAGALLPQMRQLARLSDADRRRLTKLRMQAFILLPSDQRQLILAARKLAYATDPDLLKSDDQVTESLKAEIPGASDLAKQME